MSSGNLLVPYAKDFDILNHLEKGRLEKINLNDALKNIFVNILVAMRKFEPDGPWVKVSKLKYYVEKFYRIDTEDKSLSRDKLSYIINVKEHLVRFVDVLESRRMIIREEESRTHLHIGDNGKNVIDNLLRYVDGNAEELTDLNKEKLKLYKKYLEAFWKEIVPDTLSPKYEKTPKMQL